MIPLRVPGLDASQVVLLALLRRLAVDVEGGAWAGVSFRAMARMLGGVSMERWRDLEALRARGLVERAARFEGGQFRPGWYVSIPRQVSQNRDSDAPGDNTVSIPRQVSQNRDTWTEDAALRAGAGHPGAANWIARRFFGRAETICRRLGEADVAGEALLEAIHTYDADRGVAFATHLTWCCRSKVRDSLRQDHRFLRAVAWTGEGERLDPDALDAGLDVASEVDADRERDRIVAGGGAVAEALLEGRSAHETAELLGRSVHAIRRERTKVRALAGR